MMKIRYIHYGNTKFEPERFQEVINEDYRPKPSGGFWGSPVDAEFGWKNWCERENYMECMKENSLTFTIRDDAHVLHIRSGANLGGLPMIKEEYGKIYLDFEKLRELGIDAIELHLSENPELYRVLYTWDCDSILIMNPDIIEVEAEDGKEAK